MNILTRIGICLLVLVIAPPPRDEQEDWAGFIVWVTGSVLFVLGGILCASSK